MSGYNQWTLNSSFLCILVTDFILFNLIVLISLVAKDLNREWLRAYFFFSACGAMGHIVLAVLHCRKETRYIFYCYSSSVEKELGLFEHSELALIRKK